MFPFGVGEMSWSWRDELELEILVGVGEMSWSWSFEFELESGIFGNNQNNW